MLSVSHKVLIRPNHMGQHSPIVWKSIVYVALKSPFLESANCRYSIHYIGFFGVLSGFNPNA